MIENLKKVLGIEGLKLEVVLPDNMSLLDGRVKGKIKLTTLRDTQLSSLRIKIIEKYRRGRKKNLKIDEYVMGQIDINKHVTVQKSEEKFIDFEVPFHFVQSEMDKWQEQNFIYKGLIGIAKKLKGVSSEYYILVEAKEVGTKLSPHILKLIPFK
ncbi:MAG: sporulation protein [Saprospiraceae bacterium]